MTLLATHSGLSVNFDVNFAVGIGAQAAIAPAIIRASLFGLALTLNAHRGIGESLQASQWDRLTAVLTLAVIPGSHLFQGDFNVGKLATFYFRQLGAQLILSAIQG